ncbi:MAG TPA: MFS transporter [Candidatus Acidoferrales bacterium]|jgi:MFS family permease
MPREAVATLPSTDAVRLTPIRWLVCALACIGFLFDLYEVLVLPLIVRPLLTDLGHLKPGTAAFNLWVGLLFFIPSAVGGIFGLLGGYLIDLLGRRRVLVWSMLLYACSAWAASYATSLHQIMFFRCTTLIGVCVEYVAAITWLAELFSNPKQRESVLGYAQAFYPLGGFVAAGAYYAAVTWSAHLPAIHGAHEAWRYTLLGGLIPAVPLIVIRPFLPESPLWREKKSLGTLERPSFRELFQPALRRTTLMATLLMGATAALAFGAIQQTARVVPGLEDIRNLPAKQIEQTVSHVQVLQELGGVAGRLIFALLVIRIASERRRMRLFLVPALIVFAWLYFYAATRTLAQLGFGVFLATLLFNGLHSFWGNYMPRVYPTHLRGTGGSFAMNLGGKTIAASAALATTQLANVMPGSGASVQLAYSAGTVALIACALALAGSFWLPEPQSQQLPD